MASPWLKIGKEVKGITDKILFPPQKPTISYTRRIESVKTKERVCALTFDDGPMDLPCCPDEFQGESLTAVLLDTLADFEAKGTFVVIGDTSENYPDVRGNTGSFSWGGISFDHYPQFSLDTKGGAKNCAGLISRMVAEGHQIVNHGYRHILFGKKKYIYNKRKFLGELTEVNADLQRLHTLLEERNGYSMTMGRPPHYADRINDFFTSFDAFDLMGYQYLAASFDGQGWLPSKAADPKDAEIADMKKAVEKVLEQDPEGFCGQILFQKDGYNMALRTPVAFGLREQLQLLTEAGYRVVTVQELMEYSPFQDVGAEDPDFEIFRELQRSKAIVYNDNYLRPDDLMSKGELAMLLAPKSAAVQERIERLQEGDRAWLHPYAGAMHWCAAQHLLPDENCPDAPLEPADLRKSSDFFRGTVTGYTRRDVLKMAKY